MGQIAGARLSGRATLGDGFGVLPFIIDIYLKSIAARVICEQAKYCPEGPKCQKK